MRGVTLGVIGAAAAVLLAIVVLMRGGDETPQPPVSPAPAARSRVGGATGNAAGEDRNPRVEDRLGALRAEYERRQAAAPGASQREVPTASEKSERMRQNAEDDMLAEDGDDDPEELAEARETLFNNEDPDERIGAILMLTGSEGPESMRLLMEAMDDPDAEVRLAVVEALGDRVEELTPGLLSKPLRDADPEVRFEAVSVLGDMENNAEALDLVKSATEDPDEDVRALAEGIMDFSEDEDDAADNGK